VSATDSGPLPWARESPVSILLLSAVAGALAGAGAVLWTGGTAIAAASFVILAAA